MKSLVLRLFELADGDQMPEPCSKLLVSWGDQTNGQVMSRTWRERELPNLGEINSDVIKGTWEYTVIVCNRVELDDDLSNSTN